MAVLMAGQAQRAGNVRIGTAVALPTVILTLIFLVRVSALTDNTAFYDEALYTLIGRRILQHIPDYPAARWITGSYLYPLLAGGASFAFDAGLYGVRLLSAVGTTGAALAVYLLTARLLNRPAAFLALILFGFSGVSLFVGELGTYDSLGICFLAMTTAALAYGLTGPPTRQQPRALFLGGVAFALSFLSKYVALFFLPVGVLLLGLLVLARQWDRVRQVVLYAVLPAAGIFVAYVLIFRDDLGVFMTAVGQHTSQPATRGEIATGIGRDLLFPALLGLIGGAHLLLSNRHPVFHRRILRASLRTVGIRGVAGMVRRVVPAMAAARIQVGALLLLGSAALVFPAYHLLTSNIRSLDKHMAYALIFLAPLAGWGGYQLVQGIVRVVRPAPARAVALVGCLGLLLLGIGVELDHGWNLSHNWPNKQATLDYLHTLPITRATPILAEGSDVYSLYLGWDSNPAIISTWNTGFPYQDQIGEAAMKAGITDHYFRYLIVDHYFTPALSSELAHLAQVAGYQQVFNHADRLSSGAPVWTEIYALPSGAAATR